MIWYDIIWYDMDVLIKVRNSVGNLVNIGSKIQVKDLEELILEVSSAHWFMSLSGTV